MIAWLKQKLHKVLEASDVLDYRDVLYLPDEILREITELQAVVEAPPAPSPTMSKVDPHNTILTRPDELTNYVLQPDASITGYVLKTLLPFNFNPPILYFKTGTRCSASLSAYLKQQTIYSFSYSTDENGFRKVLPNVDSIQEILVVGDSVAFGCLVNDDESAPSCLQRLVGNRVKIINAGVAGYSGVEVQSMAARCCQKRAYQGLIYIACQNDFMVGAGRPMILKSSEE